ncbi:MAG: sulfatase-like hydrolase/transferase [Acidimicrobiia bacterium]
MPPVDRAAAEQPPAEPWWRREAMLALELTGLSALAFTAPVLAAWGDSPESLIALGAGRLEIVVFALVIALAPPVVAAALGALGGRGGPQARQATHLALLGVAGGLVAWRLVIDHTEWSVRLAVVVGLVVGAVVALVRWRSGLARSFLRFAAVAPLAFLAQFLLMSPSSVLVIGRDVGAVPEAAAATAGLAEEGPPIVMVMLDALPTAALLDGAGQIDAELYPNLAELASDATWYRNHTTVAPATLDALPAMLSGRLPDRDGGPTAVDHPDNLFTLLAESYDLSVHEQVTFLCPASLCPTNDRFSLGDLFNIASNRWADELTRDTSFVPSFIPWATDRTRFERYERTFAEESFRQGERPGLFFYHLMLPHEPFELLDDGSGYGASHPPRGMFVGRWGQTGIEAGRQRFVLQLQATDRLLGQLFDRLRESGIYDDALVVVTADHGNSFVPDEPWRGVSEGNLAETLWTPLLVKEPGQAEGRVDDANVQSIDVLPTIADVLGVDLPWEVDGRPVGEARGRDGWRKQFSDWEISELRPDEGVMVTVDGRDAFEEVLAADWVPGEGSRAVWQRGEHDDLLGRGLDELTIGDPFPNAELTVEGLERWDDLDMSDFPQLEVGGHGPVPEDTPVAIGLNGTVAAVVPVEPTPFGVASFTALVLPETRREGANELTAYAVTDAPDGPVLRPVPLVPAS